MSHTLSALLLLFVLLSCGADDDSSSPAAAQDPLREVKLLTPDNEIIDASLAYRPEEQSRGLSGVRSHQFDSNDGKLFFYLQESTRTFWMPDTYFDMDLIYLDAELRIEEIVRQLPHHEGRENLAEIPRAPAIRSRHVLEMRADSEISEGLRVGDRLRWQSPLTLPQTESRIRQRL